MKLKEPFIATGIGSLPYTDYTKANEFIKEIFPEMPHWSQLPRLTASESLINQYISPLVKLGLVVVEPNRSPYFDVNQAGWLDKITEFYNLYLQILDGDTEALDFFAFPPEAAGGFYTFLEELSNNGFPEVKYIKGQIIGPVTLGLQLTDQDRFAAYYDDQLRDIVIKSIALQAYWQVKILREHNISVIIFIDEPGLYAYGQSTHITLNKEQITGELNIIIDAVHKAGASTGVHVCASTDWSIVLDSQTDILSFDAFEYFSSLLLYPEELIKFLERDGVLAFGLVPSSAEALTLTVNDLTRVFEQYLKKLVGKGVDKDRLLKQTMVTPSCGVGSLEIEVSEKIYRITQKLSHELRNKYGVIIV